MLTNTPPAIIITCVLLTFLFFWVRETNCQQGVQKELCEEWNHYVRPGDSSIISFFAQVKSSSLSGDQMMAIDRKTEGHYYIAGSFSNNLWFQGSNAFHHVPANSLWGYIAKYATNGTLQWVNIIQSEAASQISINSLETADDGTPIILGNFNGKIQTLDGASISNAENTAFLCRFNSQNGQVHQLEKMNIHVSKFLSSIAYSNLTNKLYLAAYLISSQVVTFVIYEVSVNDFKQRNIMYQEEENQSINFMDIRDIHMDDFSPKLDDENGTIYLYVCGNDIDNFRVRAYLAKYVIIPGNSTAYREWRRQAPTDRWSRSTSVAVLRNGYVIHCGEIQKADNFTFNSFISTITSSGNILRISYFNTTESFVRADNERQNIFLTGISDYRNFILYFDVLKDESKWLKTSEISSVKYLAIPHDLVQDSNKNIFSLVYAQHLRGFYEDYEFIQGNLYVMRLRSNCSCADRQCMMPMCNGRFHNHMDVCSGNGICVGPNKCLCREGYTGDYCQKPECKSSCNNGVCISPGKCMCNSGYTGDFCNQTRCDDFGQGACSGRGVCFSPNRCQCMRMASGEIYLGENCQFDTLPYKSEIQVNAYDRGKTGQIQKDMIILWERIQGAWTVEANINYFDIVYKTSHHKFQVLSSKSNSEEGFYIIGSLLDQGMNPAKSLLKLDSNIQQEYFIRSKNVGISGSTSSNGTNIIVCGFTAVTQSDFFDISGKKTAVVQNFRQNGELAWSITGLVTFLSPLDSSEYSSVATSCVIDNQDRFVIVAGESSGSIKFGTCEVASLERVSFTVTLDIVDGRCLSVKQDFETFHPLVTTLSNSRVFQIIHLLFHKSFYSTFFFLTMKSGDHFPIFSDSVKVEPESYMNCNRIVSDIADSLILAGRFQGKISINNFSLVSMGTLSDGFVFKLHQNGFIDWAVHVKGSSQVDILGISTHNSGSIFIAGYCMTNAEINTTTICKNMNNNHQNAFFAKLSKDGVLLWFRYSKLGNEFSYAVGLDILRSEKSDKIVAIGAYNGFVTFDDIRLQNQTKEKLFILHIRDMRVLDTRELVSLLNGSFIAYGSSGIFLLALIVIINCGISTIIYFLVKKVNNHKQKKLREMKNRLFLERLLLGDGDSGSSFTSSKAEDNSKPLFHIDQSMFEVKFSDLKILEEIGSGGSGSVVYSAKWNTQIVAVKIFRTTYLNDSNHFEEFENELKLLASLRNQNIVNFLGAVLENPRIAIVTEFCKKGNLKTVLNNDKGLLSLDQKIRMLCDIANGMNFLHSKNIIHRDLKSENVLVDHNFVCKVSDFGLSKIRHHDKLKMTKFVGTSVYMAPEVTLGLEYDEKCDIFSFGIIMYELLMETVEPYGPDVGINIELKVATDENFRPNISLLPELPHEQSPLINLMKQCWSHSAKQRPNFYEIINILESVAPQILGSSLKHS